MKKFLVSSFIILSFVFLPNFSFAQSDLDIINEFAPRAPLATGFAGVLEKINTLFGALLPLLVSLGVLYFVWGVVQYFIADNEEAKTTGKERIIYGIIGLAIIISIWGLVNIVVATFGVGGQGAPDLSTLTPGQNSANSGAGCPDLGNKPKLQNLLGYFTCLINDSIIPFLFAIAIVMFVWGAIKFFIIDANEEEKRTQGKQFMMWSIIALAVMISVWGLVGILRTTFGVNTGASIFPQVKP